MEIISSELFRGLTLGGSLIIAIGAQNAHILRQGIIRQSPWLTAFICSICDTILIACAIWVFGQIFQQNVWLTNIAIIGGCLYLLYFSFESFKAVFSNQSLDITVGQNTKNLRNIIMRTLMVSLLNPHALLDTFVIMGSATVTLNPAEKMSFMIGAIIASWVWFWGLSGLAHQLSPILSRPNIWRIINTIIGLILLYFAIHLFRALF